jgi:hypothetical protein
MISDRIPRKILKYQPAFWNTSEMMKGFCFVMYITGLNMHNDGKNDNDIFNVEDSQMVWTAFIWLSNWTSDRFL